MNNTPYANLSPDCILDAIESIGLHCTGSLLALNSYENRVYQVQLEDNTYIIAKFYRPERWSTEAILEEHAFSLELLSCEIPVVAPLIISNQTLHEYHDYRFALFPRVGGRMLELDSLQKEELQRIGRLIGRMHAVGGCQSYQSRLRLDLQTYGYQPYHFLLEQNCIPTEMRHNFCYTVDALLQQIEVRFAQVDDVRYLRLHGDCHAGNIVWNKGPQFVDLDDSLMGPAIQDIWMLLLGNENDANTQLETLLQGYQEFYDFNFNEIYLIESLRTLRIIHYAAWLAKRWEDPAFPRNFPWFNTARYWQDLLVDLREQNFKLDQVES